MADTAPVALPVVGSRVQSLDGHRAIVRYTGDIAKAKPESNWIGVEWDDPTRGKHDGEAYGNRYFQGNGPKSCSFLQPDKIVPATGFSDAVLYKYASADAMNADEQMAFRSKRGNKGEIFALLVGKEKVENYMKQLKPIETMTLPEMAITDVGDEAWTSERVPNITSLDLGNNLLTSIQAVADIAVHLTRLDTLALSGNRFAMPIAPPITPRPVFPSLHTLALNNTMLSWSDVQLLEPHLTNVTSLHLCGNNITSLEATVAEGAWAALERLNFEANSISDWSEVSKLSVLPKLKQIILNNNAIVDVKPPAEGTFASLEGILLGDNKIASWGSVDQLHHYKAIKEIRLKGNPLFEGMGQGASRNEVIARVGGISVFNGSSVRERERAEAEKSYIRRCLMDADEAHSADGAGAGSAGASGGGGGGGGGAEAVDVKVHPRFQALLDVHGMPVAPTKGTGSNAGGSGDMISVSVRSNAAASMTKPAVTRKLPLSMTVGMLKKMCQQLFKLDPTKQALFFRDTDSAFPDRLEEDLKPLRYYGVTDGCEILMEEVDLKREAEIQEKNQARVAELQADQEREAAEARTRANEAVAKEKAATVASVAAQSSTNSDA